MNFFCLPTSLNNPHLAVSHIGKILDEMFVYLLFLQTVYSFHSYLGDSSFGSIVLICFGLNIVFLQDMRAEAEQQIYEKLNMKIEQFLDLGEGLLFFLQVITSG